MSYHMAGGCYSSVSNFEMKGRSNLYVVDLSILPNIPDANTSFMALMIAEKFIHDRL